MHLDGEEGNLFIVDSAIAIPDPIVIDIPFHLGYDWGLDEYAGCGCHRNGRGRLYVEMATETSESVKKFIS